MSDDRTFAIFCWSLILGPALTAFITGNPWWLALYVPVAFIFGL